MYADYSRLETLQISSHNLLASYRARLENGVTVTLKRRLFALIFIYFIYCQYMTYIKSHNVYHFSNLHCLHCFNNVFHLRKRGRVILSLVATRTDVTKCVQDSLSNVSHLPAVDQRIERRIQIHNGPSKKP